MAASQRIITVDLGTSCIKAGEFHVAANGALTLLNYGSRELGIDPNKTEDRFPFVVEASQKLLAESGIKPGPTIVGVSGQSVFIRFVKLPPTEPDKVEQMIGFEAQQNVPFGLDQVVWDYQLLGGKNVAGEIEGLIVAIKSELVEEANASLAGSKLVTEKVDVSPLALVNTFLYNYPTHQDCALIVDIGARSSNLIFLDNRKVFVRSIPIAGNLISQNICNEFQEPFQAAETLKKGKGFVGLGGAYADPDDQAAARISKIARSVFSRLHAEVSRSINFYRNQQGGAPPKTVFLTGGTSSMGYSDMFFQEKLNLPVQYLNPFANVTIAPSVDKSKLAAEAGLVAPLIGLALRHAGNCPVEVSLTPPSVKARLEKRARQPYMVAAVFAFAILAVLAPAANFLTKTKYEQALAQRKTELDNVSSLTQKINAQDAIYNSNLALLASLNRLDLQRKFIPDILNQIAPLLPTEVWITSLQILTQKNARLGSPPGNWSVQMRELAGARELNYSPKPEILEIKGLVEVGESGDRAQQMIAQLATQLSTIPYIKVARVMSSESIADNPDKLALQFNIRAELNPDTVPDTMP